MDDPSFDPGEAKQILDNPVFKKAFNAFEKALFERAVEAPARDDDARMRCMMAVQALRQVEKQLRRMVFDGKSAAKAADEIAGGKSRYV